MSLFVDDIIEKIVQGIGQEVKMGFFDDDIEAVPLDPVERITEPVTEMAEALPNALTLPDDDPFDTPLDIDAMTTSARERQMARETYEQQTPGSSGAFAAAEAATGLQKPTTKKFVNRLLAKEGLPYEYGSVGQPDPVSGKPAYDCSGLIQKVMHGLGFANFPRVSHDIIAHSQPISLKKALKTRGAILYSKSASSPSGGHIAISLGNGKTIEARGEDYGVVIADAHGRFTKGGLLPELQVVKGGGGKGKKQKPVQTKFVIEQPEPTSPSLTSVTTPTAVFGTLMDEMEVPYVKLKKREAEHVPTKGVKGQLYQGFMDAGRPDLAKMVFTKAFDTWIGQESGWRVDVTSPANNQGLANDGLFQIWRGHDYNSQGQVAKMSAYEQAQLVAQNFDLTVDDIKNYAAAIRNGSYLGWG